MLKNLRLDRPLVVFDLETTGKRPNIDRIVEISTLKVLPDGEHRLHTRRLNPGVPIHPEAMKVHGIADADVAHEKRFSEIAPGLAAYLNGCDLCGYNIWSFDLKMLSAEFKRADELFSTEGRRIIDPMRIFHKREPRDLKAALKFFCGLEHDQAHQAEADVKAAVLVLDRQLERYEDLPRTISGLHDCMSYPDVVDPDGKFVSDEAGVVIFAFGGHAGKPVSEVARTDPGFLEWMLRRDFSLEAKDVARQALSAAAERSGVFSHT